MLSRGHYISTRVEAHEAYRAYSEIKAKEIDSGYFEALREQNKTDPVKSNLALLHACTHGDIEIAKLLVENDTDVNFIFDATSSLLMAVCENLHGIDNTRLNEIVCFLLESGANVNDTRVYPSPMSFACAGGYTDVVRLLLQRGADPNLKRNNSPIYRACEIENVEIITLLVQHGAKINLKNSQGQTPLHVCCMKKNVDMVRLLLENDADPNLQDENGKSPLHLAVLMTGNIDIIKLLIQNGAKADLTASNGYTPLDIAMKRKNKTIEMLSLLNQQNGSDALYTAGFWGFSNKEICSLIEAEEKPHETSNTKERVSY